MSASEQARSHPQEGSVDGDTSKPEVIDLESWLPVTGSREGKWWYATFHNVTAMVGAGVLGLPFAMSQLGCYSFISFAASIFKGSHNHAEYGPRSSSETEQAFGVLNALGTIAFAYAGHSVVLEIQATIPSSPEKPSTKPMWQGVVGAYIIVILCYLSVSVAGYWAFGNLVQDDVLISLSQPNWLIGAANAMVFLHVVGSYQVFAMPIFDLIESGLVRRLNMTPGRILRVWSRSAYVCFTCVVGICVPFFGGLLGFFGGLLFTPTTYYLPCIMWLTLKKPKRFTFHWCACWVGIVSGFSLMILAPIGGLKQIIHDAKGYKFFS